MKLIVTGSRHWNDTQHIYDALSVFTRRVPIKDCTIVHGACPTGADAIANEWARLQWTRVRRFPAEWNIHGSAAGPIRNEEMVNAHRDADFVLAFPLGESRGTRGCMKLAREAGLIVVNLGDRIVGVFLVDIDGTVAKRALDDPNVRGPFDWDRVGEDLPNLPVIEVVRALSDAGHQIIYLSGRSDVCRYQTQIWLLFQVGVMGILLMRPDGDYRPDFVVKRELYEKYVLPYEGKPIAVLDDRNSVVRMWREECDLTCLQVAEGDF